MSAAIDRKILHEPEVVPAGFGKGWTVVRGGRDEHGPFQDWIGVNYPEHKQAEDAAANWERIQATTGGKSV